MNVALDLTLSNCARLVIRPERGTDVAAREALLERCFGPERHLRTCQRLREGRLPASGLAFCATMGTRLIGTLRLWHVNAGGRPALMLGPLAVDPAFKGIGIGSALMNHARGAARERGHTAVILLGDAPYYARFGFSAARTTALTLPGPFAPERLLGLELTPDALDGASGMVMATGARASDRQSNQGGRSGRHGVKTARPARETRLLAKEAA